MGRGHPFPTNPKRQKINFGWSWRRVKPSSNKGGDPSSLTLLGVTLYWNEVFTLFPTFPQIHKVVFGWSWRRA